jgi:inosine-uridine nucleoside N-ribohydrolase
MTRTGTAAPRPRPLVFDTDMGADDWLAALLLLRSPRVEVRAITVTGAGIAHLEPGVRHALGLAALAEKESVPVAAGLERPLRGNRAFPDSWRRGADEVAGLALPANRHLPSAQPAAEVILSASHAAERVTLVATGPLTNVAAALRQDPSLARRLKMVYAMGGAVGVPGNVHAECPAIDNRVAEWNVFVDPHAAAVVLASGAPLTLVPLDATNHAPVTAEFYERLRAARATPWAEFVFQVLTRRLEPIRAGREFFWDPLAAAVAIDERFTSVREEPLEIVEEEGPECGRTRPAGGGAGVRVCSGADGAAFEEFFLRTLNG